MSQIWIVIGTISGAVSVIFGAFGAHALSARLDEKALSVYHTASQYQMYHALALVLLGLWAGQNPGASTALPGWAFSLGTLLFSGSLYALSLSGIKILGAITPLGGLGFIIGWISFAILAYRQ